MSDNVVNILCHGSIFQDSILFTPSNVTINLYNYIGIYLQQVHAIGYNTDSLFNEFKPKIVIKPNTALCDIGLSFNFNDYIDYDIVHNSHLFEYNENRRSWSVKLSELICKLDSNQHHHILNISCCLTIREDNYTTLSPDPSIQYKLMKMQRLYFNPEDEIIYNRYIMDEDDLIQKGIITHTKSINDNAMFFSYCLMSKDMKNVFYMTSIFNYNSFLHHDLFRIDTEKLPTIDFFLNNFKDLQQDFKISGNIKILYYRKDLKSGQTSKVCLKVEPQKLNKCADKFKNTSKYLYMLRYVRFEFDNEKFRNEMISRKSSFEGLIGNKRISEGTSNRMKELAKLIELETTWYTLDQFGMDLTTFSNSSGKISDIMARKYQGRSRTVKLHKKEQEKDDDKDGNKDSKLIKNFIEESRKMSLVIHILTIRDVIENDPNSKNKLQILGSIINSEVICPRNIKEPDSK